MFVIWHWLERGQPVLFIQLQVTGYIFFFVITSLRCILVIDLIFVMQLYISHYFCWIFCDICGCLENIFELKEVNIYRCCQRCSLKKAGWTRLCLYVYACVYKMFYIYIYMYMTHNLQNLQTRYNWKNKILYKRNLSHLKLVSAIFYQIFIFSPNDCLPKTMKNVFYFI